MTSIKRSVRAERTDTAMSPLLNECPLDASAAAFVVVVVHFNYWIDRPLRLFWDANFSS